MTKVKFIVLQNGDVEVEAECKNCSATGVVQGRFEQHKGPDVGVICSKCNGTGKVDLRFTPFDGLMNAVGVTTVYSSEGQGPIGKGIPYSAFKSGQRPDDEHFRSRGIGKDTTPGCFVCGGETGSYNNIAAYVSNREAGERIIGMFPQGARLDYRVSEPSYLQVKIGGCDLHRANLERLDALTRTFNNAITREIVQAASVT